MQIKYIFPAQFVPLYGMNIQASLITCQTHVTSREYYTTTMARDLSCIAVNIYMNNSG